MKKIFILLIFCLFYLPLACCAESNKIIEVINAGFSIQETPLLLNDGKILIYGTGFDISGPKKPNILFNPGTKEFKLTTAFDETMSLNSKGVPAVVLDNGKVLFIAPRHFYMTFSLSKKVYKLIPNDVRKSMHKKSITEQNKILLSYLKKDATLYKEYQQEFKSYEKSIYAQLFDPKTEKIELTGKLNIRRSGFIAVKARNGKIYIFGGNKKDDEGRSKLANEIEMYNPDSGKFKIVAQPSEFFEIHKAIPLDDGRIFLANTNINGYEKLTNYTFFNPRNNSISEWKTHNETFYEAIRLKDDRILFFTKRNDGITPKNLKYKEDNEVITKNRYNGYVLFVLIYDPKTDKFSDAGNLLIPRVYDPKPAIVLLNDGNVLVAGGIRYPKLYDFVPVYEIEIYNPNTQKSAIVGNLPFKLQNSINGAKLDDGRVLLFGSSEMYIENYSKAILFNPNEIKK